MKKYPLRLALAGVFGVSVAVAAHAAMFDLRNLDVNRALGVAKDAGTAVTGINEKDEIVIGRELAGRTLGAAPLVNDPALQQYVNKIGRWLASQSDRPDLPWRFGVIETPGVNAFAAPGGIVLITRGLYELFDNEAQLAGVLGHEIAHIVKRHHITVMQKQHGTSALAGVGQMVASSRGGAASGALNNLIGTGAEVFARGLDKDAEYESDHLGTVLAARAGYSPSGMIDVLHKLHARAGDPSTNLLTATHPHPSERLTQLGDTLAPQMAKLPSGKEPPLQVAAAGLPPPQAGARQVAPAGARALAGDQQQESSSGRLQLPGGQQQQQGGSGTSSPMDSLLRGIIRR